MSTSSFSASDSAQVNSREISRDFDALSSEAKPCVLTCLLRWSLRMNRLPHAGQENRFSPVCVRKWRCSSSERVKLLPQYSQLQTNGRSPACQRRCAFRCEVLPYIFRQPGTWQMCRRRSPGSAGWPASTQFGQRQRRHFREPIIAGLSPDNSSCIVPAPHRDGCPYRTPDRKSRVGTVVCAALHHGVSASFAIGGDTCWVSCGVGR